MNKGKVGENNTSLIRICVFFANFNALKQGCKSFILYSLADAFVHSKVSNTSQSLG